MLQPECQFGLLRSHDEVTMYASSYQLVGKKTWGRVECIIGVFQRTKNSNMQDACSM